ncbi:MAG TPA: biotin/lipoyl-containing protein, partial [Nevskiaceae bacterium]|nr:biotin/lipoyl-containing protein [Nevskiaceae bacterium]
MAEFRMPSLGADMESGLLVEWLVKPGQHVDRGQIVAVVETQKGAVDVEIWEDGIIDALLVQPGTQVPVGGVLATLQTAGHEAAAQPPPASAREAAPAPSTAPPSGAPSVPAEGLPPSAAQRLKATPAARRRAEALGVDLSRIVSSAPDGVIGLDDVERFA